MSIAAIEWVWEHSRARWLARLVLLAIAEHADALGANAWPSVPRLARMTGLSERGVQNASRELEQTGELVVEVGAGPGGVNRYRLAKMKSAQPEPEAGASGLGVGNAVEKAVEKRKKRGPP